MAAVYLVVDDSRAMRAFVKGALEAAFDCRVDEATSGFEALRLLPRSRYDAVIADVNMPDINGFELIRLVRASKHHGDVPIIVISTQISDADLARARSLGANGFVRKPFEGDEIVRAVTACPARAEATP